MTETTIYGPAFSTYARSLRLALEEKGAPYNLVEVDLLSGAHKGEEHTARQPFGKVPAFEHDGFTIYETVPILKYIDSVFEGPDLQPSGPRERARSDQILAITDNYAYPAMIGQIVIQRVVQPLVGRRPTKRPWHPLYLSRRRRWTPWMNSWQKPVPMDR